ncbi:hypothetical protein TNCV_1528831 [Trichonephila clavipes]|nr:hypothetical protein TNCV_1528831 [Trichonephila clavipes]
MLSSVRYLLAKVHGTIAICMGTAGGFDEEYCGQMMERATIIDTGFLPQCLVTGFGFAFRRRFPSCVLPLPRRRSASLERFGDRCGDYIGKKQYAFTIDPLCFDVPKAQYDWLDRHRDRARMRISHRCFRGNNRHTNQSAQREEDPAPPSPSKAKRIRNNCTTVSPVPGTAGKTTRLWESRLRHHNTPSVPAVDEGNLSASMGGSLI